MSKVDFSAALFEQMGGVNWQARPDIFPEQPVLDNRSSSESLEITPERMSDLDVNAEISEEQVVLQASSSQGLMQPEQIKVEESIKVEEPTAEYLSEPKQELGSSIVLLGAGLDGIWQNEESTAWQLWQNIMLAFQWDESNVVFFDTSNIVSEDAIFSTIEEVIDLGVEWVLTMDEEHTISEQLVEGVHVVTVPDLELMLSDPYSKQSFYQSVMLVQSESLL